MRRKIDKRNDMPMQGTVDRCKAATLVQFFEQDGGRVKSVSELTRLTVDTLVAILTEKLGIEAVTDTAIATTILEKISYGTSFLSADRYASAALKNMQLDAQADTQEFELLPKRRGRQPSWSEADDIRLVEAANKALDNPRIKKLLEQQRSGDK